MIVAACGGGTSLPNRQNITGTNASKYPHDYLDYDSQRGIYIFSPKPGARLPEMLAHDRY